MTREEVKMGMKVRYWPVMPHEEYPGIAPVYGEIRNEPWQLGHGTWVVSITGKTGGLLLSHLEQVVGEGER